MAARVPGSSTRVLFDAGCVYDPTRQLIRVYKHSVCVVLGGNNAYFYNVSNDTRRTDPIEWEILKLLCHDFIIDLFFDENGIIYLCEHGCTHRYDAAMSSTRILQPLSTANTMLSIHPFCAGFYAIVSTDKTKDGWLLNVRSLTSLSKQAVLSYTRKKLSPTPSNYLEKTRLKFCETLKPVVVCLNAASTSCGDYSVAVDTSFFSLLFGNCELTSRSFLVGFPDGQVCSFTFKYLENSTPVASNSRGNLICCVQSQVMGIFVLSLNGDLLCDCICVIGENGKVIVLQLSHERENSVSLIEFHIPKPVLACDINKSTLIHCNGRHIYSTELKIKKTESVHSRVCSDIVGVTDLKIIHRLNDDSMVTVINTSDGRTMQITLNLTHKINRKSDFSQMKSVFTKIQTCSEKLLEMTAFEEKQRNILSSLSTALTLLLSGKATEYFECGCLVHSCTIAHCTLAVSVKNMCPYKLNCETWSFSCIIKWPLNSLTQEKQNQIFKSQPLTTDLKQGDVFTCFVTIPLDTLTSGWQFPLKVTPFFVAVDSRVAPGKPIAVLQLRSFNVTELNVLETCHRGFLPSEDTLQQKIWKMAQQRQKFDAIFQKLPREPRVSLSTEILCVGEVSLCHLIPGLSASNSDCSNSELFWRGHKVAFIDVKDEISTKIQLTCDHLGLLAKLRCSIMKKLEDKRNERSGEVEFITLPQSAIQSHLEVTSLMDSYYSMDVAQQLQCLMHLYYELRNRISSKLPLIINDACKL